MLDTLKNKPVLTPFNEQNTAHLSVLGFTISATRNGERALFTGESNIEITRSGDDQLALVITMPGGREIAAYIPREVLDVDDDWDEVSK
jgi:hypothetical protein